jgi:hypothetical protein
MPDSGATGKSTSASRLVLLMHGCMGVLDDWPLGWIVRA